MYDVRLVCRFHVVHMLQRFSGIEKVFKTQQKNSDR